ncbi:hypothetical protein VIGAN_10083400, partial [Vigna angularis var. angularis]
PSSSPFSSPTTKPPPTSLFPPLRPLITHHTWERHQTRLRARFSSLLRWIPNTHRDPTTSLFFLHFHHLQKPIIIHPLLQPTPHDHHPLQHRYLSSLHHLLHLIMIPSLLVFTAKHPSSHTLRPSSFTQPT